jgi:tRNA threonylcarbamoyladenosine biosynthesis protein TsaB
VSALPLDEESYAEIKKQAVLFGDGAVKASELLQLPVVNSIEEVHAGCILSGIEASAMDMADLALEYFKAEKFLDLAYFEPYYHKDFVAGKPNQLFGNTK